jgi:hypothetical protein
MEMYPTRDHNVIRSWVEKHDGVAAEVIPFKFDGEPTILHFLFGEAKAGTPELRPISWDDFFARFDLLGLSLAFDDETPRYQLVRVEKSMQAGMGN